MAAPTVIARNGHVGSTTNSTSYTPTISAIGSSALIGDQVLLFVSNDGNGTMTMNSGSGDLWDGLTATTTAANSTIVRGTLFIATVNTDGSVPNPSLTCSASEQFSCVAILVRSSTGILGYYTNTSNGSSTNSDPAAVTNSSGASKDFLVIASRHGDSTVVASAAPSGYGNLQTRTAGGTNGASTNTAELSSVTIANSGTENPGTFTSASEQWACITVGLYEAPPVFEQKAFRFYEDGTESGAAALAAQNTNIEIEDVNTVFGLRIMIQETASVSGNSTDDWMLQRNWNSGGWTNVTASSNTVNHYGSTNVTDLSATTNRLTGGTGTFQAGKLKEQDFGVDEIQNFQLLAGRYTEFLWVVQIPGIDSSVGDVFDFRVTRNGTVVDTVTVTPRVTIVAPAPDYTLTATGGSYTLTGTAASLNFNRAITAAAGSYTLTGTAATLAYGKIMAADSGSYTLTGTAANLLFNRSITMSGGSYALTGTAATLAFNRVVVADPGSYTLTGTDATFFRGRGMTADSGSFTLTGTDANFIVGRVLAANAGSYTLSGTDANLAYGRTMPASAGSYALTGTDATLAYIPVGGYTMVANSGSFAVTDTNANLVYGRIMVAAAGSYTLTGTAAALKFNRVLVATGGSYALTGTATTFQFQRLLTASSGSYTLSGTVAALTYQRKLIANVGSYVLTGTDASLLYGGVTFRRRMSMM